MVLIISLTDVSRCNRARQRGGGWLKCRVDRSDNSRPGARPRRRLVTRGSNHSRNSLGRCLIARGVHRRARGRSPRHVVAILDRLVCLRSVASGRRSRDDGGRGGEHRQDEVEGEDLGDRQQERGTDPPHPLAVHGAPPVRHRACRVRSTRRQGQS